MLASVWSLGFHSVSDGKMQKTKVICQNINGAKINSKYTYTKTL